MDTAFEWLTKGLDQYDFVATWINVDPGLRTHAAAEVAINSRFRGCLRESCRQPIRVCCWTKAWRLCARTFTTFFESISE